MVRRTRLSSEAFDRLLDWLAPSRETSAAKYQEIHEKLTRLFSCKGVDRAEDLADEVMDRVASKLLQQSAPPFANDHLRWFYAFSKYVYLEYCDEVRRRAQGDAMVRFESTGLESVEKQHRCLDHCLGLLGSSGRDFLLRYYGYADGEKVRHRRAIADELHIPLNALRIRISRIRSSVGDCVKRCVRGESSSVQ
jgi:DNA-directed RNA polymerase specialized sigma24 family protein